jgi:hypothetical protein
LDTKSCGSRPRVGHVRIGPARTFQLIHPMYVLQSEQSMSVCRGIKSVPSDPRDPLGNTSVRRRNSMCDQQGQSIGLKSAQAHRLQHQLERCQEKVEEKRTQKQHAVGRPGSCIQCERVCLPSSSTTVADDLRCSSPDVRAN